MKSSRIVRMVEQNAAIMHHNATFVASLMLAAVRAFHC